MSQRSKATATLLSFFTGPLGLHKFYLGRPLLGLFYIISYFAGIASIDKTPIILIPVALNIIDLLYLIIISQETFNRRYNGVTPPVAPAHAAMPGAIPGGIVINVTGNHQTNTQRQ